MELISVVIAIHNGEQFLKDTLDSLINQTYKNIEIIIVVNCSDDMTLNILSTYDDKRIKIYTTDICQLAFNLNYGLLKAKGRYIARIDADDVAENFRIEKQINVLKERNYDVVGSNITYINEYGESIGSKKYPEFNSKIRKQIIFTSPIAHPSIMYKRELILNNRGYLNGMVSEDYDLWLRLMRDENIIFYNIQQPLTKYRIHTSQAKGNNYAYMEIAGYFLREALFLKSFKLFLASLIYIFKAIIK